MKLKHSPCRAFIRLLTPADIHLPAVSILPMGYVLCPVNTSRSRIQLLVNYRDNFPLLENSSLVTVLFKTKRNWSWGEQREEILQRMEIYSPDDVPSARLSWVKNWVWLKTQRESHFQ